MNNDIALDNRMFLNSEFDCALQELDILFGTTKTELLNMPTFGVSFEEFLWETTPSPEAVRKYTLEKLETLFFVNKFDYDCKVEVEDEYDSVSFYRVIIELYNPITKNKASKVYTYK